MFATDRLRALLAPSRLIALALAGVGIAGVALGADIGRSGADVARSLKGRLPKTPITNVNCTKIQDLCEVTAGSNLFYVDRGARYLIIGRVYDMESRQDLTAARLLEMNPDMLVGGAAKANAASGENSGAEIGSPEPSDRAGRATAPERPSSLDVNGLGPDGAIIWGKRSAARTVTVFTDFRCGYCRALANVLRTMDVKVIERPISVLGSRDIAERVYCAKDRESALHAAYAGEPFTSATGCDTKGLDANERFARQHGLNATPVIVREDGALLEGYRPRAVLEAWLRGGRS